MNILCGALLGAMCHLFFSIDRPLFWVAVSVIGVAAVLSELAERMGK